MSKWISVKDELPKKSDHNDYTRSVIVYVNRNKCQYTACYDYSRSVWVCFRSFEIISGVTYWQPLPEPPEEE